MHADDVANIEPARFGNAIVSSLETQLTGASGDGDDMEEERGVTFTVTIMEQTAMAVAAGIFDLIGGAGEYNKYVVLAFIQKVEHAACQGMLGTCVAVLSNSSGTRRRLQGSSGGGDSVNISLTREYDFAGSNSSVSVAALVREGGVAVASAETTRLSAQTTVSVVGDAGTSPLTNAVGRDGLGAALAMQLPTLRVTALSATSTPPTAPPSQPPDQPKPPPTPPLLPPQTSSEEQWQMSPIMVALVCIVVVLFCTLILVSALRHRSKKLASRRSHQPPTRSISMMSVVPSPAKHRCNADASTSTDESWTPSHLSQAIPSAVASEALDVSTGDHTLAIPSSALRPPPRAHAPRGPSGGTSFGGSPLGIDFCPRRRMARHDGCTAAITSNASATPLPGSPPALFLLPAAESPLVSRTAWEEPLPTKEATGGQLSTTSQLQLRPSEPIVAAAAHNRNVPPLRPCAGASMPAVSSAVGKTDIIATDMDDDDDTPLDDTATLQPSQLPPAPRLIASERIQELQVLSQGRQGALEDAQRRLETLRAARRTRAPVIAAVRLMAAARRADQVLPPSAPPNPPRGKEPPLEDAA